MKTTLLILLILLLGCTCFAQTQKGTNPSSRLELVSPPSGSYCVTVKNVSTDSTYVDENIFITFNDGTEKNIAELTAGQLRYTVKFILKTWEEHSQREYKRQQRKLK